MVKLTEREVEAIEKALNRKGASEAVVKIEQGKVVVLMSQRRKIL